MRTLVLALEKKNTSNSFLLVNTRWSIFWKVFRSYSIKTGFQVTAFWVKLQFTIFWSEHDFHYNIKSSQNLTISDETK